MAAASTSAASAGPPPSQPLAHRNRHGVVVPITWPPPHLRGQLQPDDANDNLLMLICGALAAVSNRALCPKEIAEVRWRLFAGLCRVSLSERGFVTFARLTRYRSAWPAAGRAGAFALRCCGCDRGRLCPLRRRSSCAGGAHRSSYAAAPPAHDDESRAMARCESLSTLRTSQRVICCRTALT